MHIHDETDSDKSGKQSGDQVEEIRRARTSGTEAWAHRALKSPPDWANAGDDTENTETLEGSSPIHTYGNTEHEVKTIGGLEIHLTDTRCVCSTLANYPSKLVISLTSSPTPV